MWSAGAGGCCGGAGANLPAKLLDDLPKTPAIGYDGKFNMDWSLIMHKKDWPVTMPDTLPSYYGRLMEFVTCQEGALTLPKPALFRSEEFKHKEKSAGAFKIKHLYA